MSLLRWKDEYLTQVEEIDTQHRRLFDLINGIYDLIRVGRGSDSIVEALGEVVETARGIIAGYRTDNADLRTQLTAATARAEKAEAELLQVRTTGHAEAIGRFIRIAERLDDYYMGGNNLRDTLQNIVGDANDAANYARAIVLCVHKKGNQ